MRNRTKLFLCEVEDLFILDAVLVYEDVRSSLKVQENNLVVFECLFLCFVNQQRKFTLHHQVQYTEKYGRGPDKLSFSWLYTKEE